MKPKVIILSAPSGSGKTTIAREILEDEHLNCSFSVSATSRPPREHERDGEHYYFLSPETFRKYISQDKFVEWEEVYHDQFYGTLKSEVERLSAAGKNILFDVDVKGGVNLKRYFGDDALSVFVMPPSIEELTYRLKNRRTENEENLRKRLKRAGEELTYAPRFDVTVINDDLPNAVNDVKKHIADFIGLNKQ